jgi:magnesium-transporting ATPase (P-type)
MPKPISLTTKQPWHHWEIEQVLSHLQSQFEGLTYVVARQRLRRYGRSQLPRQRRIMQIATQPLTNPLAYCLLAIAAVVQYVGGEGWPLLAIGSFHACVGMWLTVSATRIRETTLVRRLSKDDSSVTAARSKAEVVVRRDGESMAIATRDLVLGDIVEIQPGDRPIVDLRLCEAEDLQTDQTSIGSVAIAVKQAEIALPQSTPALERTNMVYAGTTIVSGRGVGVVVATGRHVYGQRMARREQPVSISHHLLRRLRWIWLLVIGLAIAAIVGMAIYRGETNWYTIGWLGLAIAIATYPQNLLRIATLTQLLGMQNLAKKRLWVKFPSAIDALARLSAIVLILDSDIAFSIDNLSAAGIKWHGLIRAYQNDADALGKVLGIEVSSYFDAPLERMKAWQTEHQSRCAAIAAIAKEPEDIPFLRQADVGICARTSAKVVQDSAGLILPREYYHYIPLAIAEARGVCDRLQRIVLLILTSTVALVMIVLAAFSIKVTLVPLQIIWIGAIATPLLALTFILEPTPANIMTRPARHFQSILRLGNYLRLGIAVSTLLIAVGAVFWFKYQGVSALLPVARTIAFTTLLFGQIFYTCSLFRTSIVTNLPLVAVGSFLIVAQAAMVSVPAIGEFFATTPLNFTEWAIAALAATSIFWVEELTKTN